MISATGMRPSDIVTAANGKTIEVHSIFFGSYTLKKDQWANISF